MEVSALWKFELVRTHLPYYLAVFSNTHQWQVRNLTQVWGLVFVLARFCEQ